MADIVERLRKPPDEHPLMLLALCDEAADEIERLRAALQALHDWYVEYARINNLVHSQGLIGNTKRNPGEEVTGAADQGFREG